MKALAGFIMRGHSQAALVATAAALLSLLMPLFGPVGAAAVGLVTLRNGARQGLTTIALALLGAGILSALALGSPWLALGILLVFWAPIWTLAVVLRASRSLALTIQLAGMLGLILVLALHVSVGDPVAYWSQLLDPLRQTLLTDGLMQAEAGQALFDEVARRMTGLFAAALVFQLLMSLFIARWWQAALYHPGGFGEEFRALRLGRSLGAVILVLLVWSSFAGAGSLIVDLLPILGMLLILQGLAVAHWLRQARGVHRGWLIGLYALLILFMPQMGLLIACVGLVDLWADIRARVAQRASGPR
ncbi:DUF2232 domain-containing protein [Thiobaca trueperi]|uniref:Putative membrane protein DUF2232 n=1 Tax=Thiobaca trueperi TaxID=127458 RepID=A0A4R3MXQ0_9GAMM|nr:DUF2232 domain-containing protein [Thiobaca trueperi]TCT20577.1 putative membrane protein DUF2232 [Thiobaca trueperi]